MSGAPSSLLDRARRRRAEWGASALAGLLLAGAHAALLPGWLASFARPELSVQLDHFQPRIPAGTVPFHAALPPALAPRVSFTVDGAPSAWPPSVAPGPHRLDWQTVYQGGFQRRVGLTVLAGPAPDPGTLPCSVRVRVARDLLDPGEAVPGSVAGLVKQQLEAQLSGQSVPLLREFQRVESVQLRWAALSNGEHALVVGLVVSFARGTVPVGVAFAPTLADGRLLLVRKAAARVEGKSWFEDLASYLAGGDGLATDLAQEQVDQAAALIEDALRAPPPLYLPGGPTLALAYCDGAPLRVQEGDAIVSLGLLPWEGASPVAPLALPRYDEAPPSSAPLSIDLDLNALNGVLHTLWASGYLDQQLARAGLTDWFQRDERVKRFLSLRLAALSLALPPVLAPGPQGALSLWIEAALTLDDRGTSTAARVFGRFTTSIAPDAPGVAVTLQPDDLALRCDAPEGTLHPCYADLFPEVVRQQDALLAPLQQELRRYLGEMLAQLSIRGPGVEFSITRAQAELVGSPGAPWARLSLEGTLDH